MKTKQLYPRTIEAFKAYKAAGIAMDESDNAGAMAALEAWESAWCAVQDAFALESAAFNDPSLARTIRPAELARVLAQ